MRSWRRCAGAASAQDKTFELRLSHWVPPSHPLQKALEDWGASVEKASNGTIKSKVYPVAAARQGVRPLRHGARRHRRPHLHQSRLSARPLPDHRRRRTAVPDVATPRAARRRSTPGIANTPSKEMKDVKFCLAFVHDPGTFHSKTKKIMVPGDIKGMKIRPAHATMATFVTQLGGTNVQSSAPEVRDIIEKGVADAVTFPWGSIPLFGIDKVTKYHMDAPLYATTFAFVFNKAKYDADVGGAEEGDRRPLHQRMGAARSRARGPTSSMPASQSSRPIRRTRSIRSRRRSSPSGEGRRAAGEDLGRQREEGRRRSGRDHEGAQGRRSRSSTRRIDRTRRRSLRRALAIGCRLESTAARILRRRCACDASETGATGVRRVNIATTWIASSTRSSGSRRCSSASSPPTSSSR